MIKYGFNLAYWFNEHNLNMHQALDEISLTGWSGVELVRNQPEFFYDDIDYFNKLIKLHNLEVTSFYCEFSLIYENKKNSEIESLKRKCDFLKNIGCDILLIDGGIKDLKKNNNEYYKIATENINEVGYIAKELGLKTSWHQHWGSMFDTYDSFEFLMNNTNPKLIGFCPDTAQLLLSNMDPVNAIKRYSSRINYIHFKDIIPNNFIINRVDIVNNLKKTDRESDRGFENYEYFMDKFLDNGAYHINSKYKFTEVGRGIIDFENICKIIKEIDYDGWIVVDQDYTEWSLRDSLDVNLKNIKYFMGQ